MTNIHTRNFCDIEPTCIGENILWDASNVLLKFLSNVQNLVHLHLCLPNKNIYTHNVTINENLLHFPIFYMLEKVNVNFLKIGNVSVNHLHFFTQCLYVYLHLPSQNWSTIQEPKANKTFCLIQVGSISQKKIV